MLLYHSKITCQKMIWLFLSASLLCAGLVFAGQYIVIRDEKSGIEIQNLSSQNLRVRISFVVPLEKQGFTGVCNPYGLPFNKEVPLPEVALSEFDRSISAGHSLRVPGTACGHYLGYSVWVRDASGQLLEEIHE